MEKTTAKLSLFASAFFIMACASVRVAQHAQPFLPAGAARIEPDQAVAILTSGTPSAAQTIAAVGCIDQAINTSLPNVRIIGASEFRRTVFDYSLPEDHAERAKYLNLLVNQPALKTRMMSSGIRYLIVPHSVRTDMTETGGFAIPVAFVPYPAPAALYMVYGAWDRRSQAAASIIDVWESRPAGELQFSASSKPWIFVMAVLPIGAPAFTEQEACKALGDSVVKFLAGDAIDQTPTQDREPK